jgi:hypothetical protein
MWYRLEVRLTPADVGKQVVIRWRRPEPGVGDQIADVLGILEQADASAFKVRIRGGKLMVIPAERALAGKVVPPPPSASNPPTLSLADWRRQRPARGGEGSFLASARPCVSSHTA